MSIYFFFFPTLLSLLPLCFSEQSTSLEIGTINQKEKYNANHHYYSISIHKNEEYSNNNYILISTLSSNAAHLYISHKYQFPTYQASTFKSFTNQKNIVYIPYKSYEPSFDKLFLKVFCDVSPCEYRINAIYKKDIIINDVNNEINIYSIKNSSINVIVKNEDLKGKYVLYVISSGIKEFTIDNIEPSSIEFKKVFANGFGYIINDDKNNETISFQIKMIQTTNVIIGKRKIENKYTYMNILDKLYGMISINDKECFILNSTSTNDDSNDYYSLNFLAYIEGLYIDLISKETSEVKRSEIGKENNYFLFSKDELNNNYFCIYYGGGDTFSIKNSTISHFGFVLQLIETNHLFLHQDFYSPLIPGVTTRFYLRKNNVIYHHLSPKYSISSRYEITLKKKKGNPILYGMSCDNIDIPCQVRSDQIEELKNKKKIFTAHMIHGFIHVTLNTFSTEEPKEYVAIVYCESELIDCAYTITMKSDQDITIIRNGHKMMFPIKKDITDSFIFRIYRKDYEKMTITLLSFSGKAEMKTRNIEKDNQTYWISENNGNKNMDIYFLRDPDKLITKLIPLDGDYEVKITGITNSFYMIGFKGFTQDNYDIYEILKGITTSDYLSSYAPNKTFTFKNFRIGDNISYLIKITNYNCKMNITFDNNLSFSDVNNFQFEITKDYPFYYNEVYSLQLTKTSPKLESYSRCTLKISNDEISSEQEMILNEGISYDLNFNSHITNFTFIYPYWFEGYGQSLLVTLTSYSIGEIFYKYSIEGGDFTKEQILSRTKKLMITSYELEQKCFIGYLCSIIFKVRLNPKLIEHKNIDDQLSIYFKIFISSTNKIPQYLPKESILIRRIFEGKDQFFYTDITPNDLSKITPTGKIYINFLRGSGIAVAKLVRNDITEINPDWNNRVNLPKVTTKDRLPYDYYNNVIYFTYDDIQICQAGCELYIGIISGEMGSHLYSEFSILVHTHDLITSISPNEFVFGNLYDNSYEEDLEHIVQYDISSIYILFNCNGCNATIYINFPNIDRIFNWTVVGSHVVSVNDEIFKDLEITTLYQAELFIHFNRFYFEDITVAKYMFQILIPEQNVEKKIIRRETLYDEPCNIENNDDYCYYIVPVFDFDYLSNLILYSECDYKMDRNAKIYVNFVRTEIFENLGTGEITNYLPNEQNYNYSSTNGYLSITSSNKGEFVDDGYYLISFHPRILHKNVNLLLTHYLTPATTALIPNIKNIFNLKNVEKELTIKIFGNFTNQYIIDLIWINGQGFASEGSEKELLLNENIQYISYIVSYDGDISKSQLANLPADNPIYIRRLRTYSRLLNFTFYAVNSIISMSKANDMYIKIPYTNKIHKYLFKNETHFPILYYLDKKGLIESDGEVYNILLNYHISFNQQYIRYNGKLLYIPKDNLTELRKGDYNISKYSYSQKSSSLIEIKLINAFDLSYSIINKKDIIDYNDLCPVIWIDSVYNMKPAVFSDFDINVLLYNIEKQEDSLEYDKLIISEVNSELNNLFVVSNSSLEKTYVEFAFYTENTIHVWLSLKKNEHIFNQKISKNKLDIEINDNILFVSANEINNITYIVIQYLEPIYMNITSTKNVKYLLRYVSSKENQFYHKPFEKTQVKFYNNKEDNNEFIFSANEKTTKYILTLYNKTIVDTSKEEKSSILFREDALYSFIINHKSNTDEEISYNIKKVNLGEYYATLLGVTDNNNYIIYDITSIKINANENTLIWLWSLCGVAIICCVVFVYVICKKKSSNSDEKNSSFIENAQSEGQINSQKDFLNQSQEEDDSSK